MDEVIPNHVAIIMDGNGRWAKEKRKERSYGHYHGFLNFKKLSKYIYKKGVKVLSVYAFSTENFKRDKKEVSYLMNLFMNKFKDGLIDIEKMGVKLIFSGHRERPLPKGVIKTMNELEERTKNNIKGILNICINYGGHLEIIDATKKIYSEIDDIESLNEELYNSYLYNELPPVDLLIRTGKEYRISNFMLWQLAYAELYFSNIYFPDFNEKEFDKAILEFSSRNRRFGGN